MPGQLHVRAREARDPRSRHRWLPHRWIPLALAAAVAIACGLATGAAGAQAVLSHRGDPILAEHGGAAARERATKEEETMTSDDAKAAAETGPLHLGIVLYPGFEPLDVFGPLEMFMNVGAERLRIHMLAEEAGLVPSSAASYPPSIAPRVEATTSLADAPPLDVILVPGGFGTVQAMQSEPLLAWLRERAPAARFTTSVCSGSAILARAGLLDSRRATSNKQLFSFVAAQGPGVDWQKSARWVEDGALVTSSGVSAGIDMALALIEKLFDTETAEAIAAGTEYEWHRDPTVDPFARYLDQGIPGLGAGSGGRR